MGEFRFKKFSVSNERSAMKVNSDGVLLGAAVTLTGREKSVLDAGTGTGTIALMIAQRLAEKPEGLRIIGIDIDWDSASEAGDNFAASPWSGFLQARHQPLALCEGKFDLIVSNPPYYDSSLQNPDFRKTRARHMASIDEENRPEAALSYRTLLDFSALHLTENGRLGVIFPADMEKTLVRYAGMCGLETRRILHIRTVPQKSPSRIIVEFVRGTSREEVAMEEITIQKQGRYSEEYTALVKEFYLWA